MVAAQPGFISVSYYSEPYPPVIIPKRKGPLVCSLMSVGVFFPQSLNSHIYWTDSGTNWKTLIKNVKQRQVGPESNSQQDRLWNAAIEYQHDQCLLCIPQVLLTQLRFSATSFVHFLSCQAPTPCWRGGCIETGTWPLPWVLPGTVVAIFFSSIKNE